MSCQCNLLACAWTMLFGVAVGLCLACPSVNHHCKHCGVEVDHMGTHGLSCCYSRECPARHADIKDIIKQSSESAKIPCHLEPTGLYKSDGKRPDEASIVPWKGGKVPLRDATCLDTLIPSYSVIANSSSCIVLHIKMGPVKLVCAVCYKHQYVIL